jgi:hypothetical protein
MIKFTSTLTTSGTGYWSTARKGVRTTGIDVAYIAAKRDFGELRVYFDTQSWDVATDGLIYTDGRFLMELVGKLADAGFDVLDVSYSEQGMQRYNYVSLDVGKSFLDSWFDIVGTTQEV